MLDAVQLTEHIGTEVRGLDLAAGIGDAVAAQLRDTLARRGVLLIRGQSMDVGQFMAFSRQMGPLAIHSLNQFSKPGFPELMVNSNIIENGKPLGLADAGRDWHTDGAYRDVPYRSTILYSLEIPIEGGRALGDTVFVSTARAYDELDEPMKQRLAGLQAVHSHGVAREKRGHGHKFDGSLMKEIQKGVEHPVVRTHPDTGRKCLYVDEGTTLKIAGLPEEESQALIATLLAHVLQEDRFGYRHNWRVGDVLLWDNCSTLHKALGDYALPMRRLIYRTLVQGVKPS